MSSGWGPHQLSWLVSVLFEKIEHLRSPIRVNPFLTREGINTNHTLILCFVCGSQSLQFWPVYDRHHFKHIFWFYLKLTEIGTGWLQVTVIYHSLKVYHHTRPRRNLGDIRNKMVALLWLCLLQTQLQPCLK